MGGKAPLPAGTGRSGVPMLPDRGVLITSPGRFDKFFRGERVNIRFRVNEGIEPHNVAIVLQDRAGNVFESEMMDSGLPFFIDIPDDVPEGSNYYIVARNLGTGELLGASDPFEIHRNTAVIRILSPAPDEEIVVSSGFQVEYQFSQRIKEGRVRVELSSIGLDPPRTASLRRSYYPGPSNEHAEPVQRASFSGFSCGSYPPGRYVLTVSYESDDESQNFEANISIHPVLPGEGGPFTRAAWGIDIVTPRRLGSAPTRWVCGNTEVIAWQLTGTYPEERNFIVTLRHGSDPTPVATIPTNHLEWRESRSMYILHWRVPADLSPDSLYRIVITERNSPVEAQSVDFTIASSGLPTLTIWEPHGDSVWFKNHSYRIEWASENFPSSARIDIDLVGPDGIDHIAKNVPISNGGLDWTVRPGRCRDFMNLTYDFIGVREEPIGTMGGVGFLTGTYRFVIQYRRDNMIFYTSPFRIEENPRH